MIFDLRRAGPEDAAAIAAVHVRAWQAGYRGMMPDELLDALSVTQRQAVWGQLLSREDGPRVHVAVADGNVVGFCAVAAPSRDEDADEGVAEIAAIYVHPDTWRSGIGRALMDAALDELQAGGWRWVTLWVLAENQPARDFYARFGFTPDAAEATHAASGRREVRLRRFIPARTST